jgi:prepilin-type N-terminal cleavage/methylation domain-containing protein
MVVRELEEVFNSLDHQEAQNVHFPSPEEDYAVIKRENRRAGALKKGHFHMYGKGGFTLVEVVVVVAIVAILAVVATPAYMNYVNRTKQGEAASLLFTARLEMEEFYTDNGRYASTIQCLPSFVAGANTSCLTNCGNCNAVNANIHYYTFHVAQNIAASGATLAYYQVAATRQIYSYASADQLTISATTDTPIVQNTNALKFSIFQWIFQ